MRGWGLGGALSLEEEGEGRLAKYQVQQRDLLGLAQHATSTSFSVKWGFGDFILLVIIRGDCGAKARPGRLLGHLPCTRGGAPGHGGSQASALGGT